jgi:heptosyltransferase-2
LPEPAAVRVLVVHRAIGDAVVITPLLRALRACFPSSELVLVLSPLVEPLFRRDGRADRLLVVAPRPGEGEGALAARTAAEAGPADLAFVLDFTGLSARIAARSGAAARIGYDDHGRGWRLTHTLPWPPEWNRATADYPPGTSPRHQAERWLALGALAGAQATDARPDLAHDRARRWEDLLPDCGIPEDARVLLVHPGSDSSYRWRPERWAETSDRLADRHGLRVVLSGGPGDGPVVEAVRHGMKHPAPDSVGRGLETAVDVAARAALVLSVDTSLSHIASAVGTPVVTLFGPGDPGIWRPFGGENRVVRDPGGRCGGCKLPRCPLAEHLCMDGIAVDDVIRAAEPLLTRPAAEGERR